MDGREAPVAAVDGPYDDDDREALAAREGDDVCESGALGESNELMSMVVYVLRD
jgi:hypothetical protein